MISRAVDVEACGVDVAQRDSRGGRADFEGNFVRGAVVACGERARYTEQVVVVEAVNNILAVAACINECIGTRVAPK